MSEDRTKLELPIREACEAGDVDGAVTRAVELYGRDVYAFLAAMLRSEADAGEVFSEVLEKFWVGLPSFAWRSSLRGWAYTVARNAAISFIRSKKRRRERHLSVEQYSRLSALVDQVRSSTAFEKKTDTRSRIRELREMLSEEEQTLLILRVDRGLSFRELALTMTGGSIELQGEALAREAATMRKRFERARDKLKALAEKEGLFSPDRR